MNPRSTGILFVAAAAIAAFLYFYEIGGEQERADAEEAEKRLFAGLEQEAIGLPRGSFRRELRPSSPPRLG